VQLSSAPEDQHYHRSTIPRTCIRTNRSQRRSASVALTRRTVEQLRGGSDGRRPGGGDGGGGGDDDDDENERDPYYGYNNYPDDRDDYYRRDGDGGGGGGGGGGYYSFGGDYNDNDNSGRYGGSSQSMNDDQGDDYRSYNNNNDSRRNNDNVGRERRGRSFYDDDERYREDDYGYNRYDDSYSRNKSSSSSSPAGLSRAMPRVLRKGNKKYGMMMLGSGTALTALGMALVFNKGLMRLGNLLFVGGVPMFIGPTTTMKYFLNPAKARATGCVVAGVFLVFVGWPILGILMEIFGLLNLFGNMFPLAMYFLRSLPGVGSLFPKNDNGRGRPKSKRRDYDDYDPYERYHDEGEEKDYGDDDGYGGGSGGGGGYY